ncbi:MAG: CusA/CzcA family heavy metal efflux RND transporter, partial [Patescibacteria group bacterium]
DAIPDLSENQVIIMTEWMWQTPKNVEDQLTYPLTVSMQGLAGVRTIRATSMLGLSMVTVIFEDNVGIYFARDRVSERLRLIQAELPEGVTPILGPDATGVGHVFLYTLESDRHTLTELRTMQDFIVRYGLQSLPGIAEVSSVGGYVKSYQVILDPKKLIQYDIGIMEVMESLKAANNNVSGKVVDTGGREVAIQGIGFFQGTSDIASTVIGEKADGIPLTVEDIGEVRISGLFRRAILADAEEEKVGGVVVMRYGGNPLKVIEAVKEEIPRLEQLLPEGVTIRPFYDRSHLIRGAISTVRESLLEEMIITAIVLGLFLWNISSTFIIAAGLSVGVLITFIFMSIAGVPSNIMSLGGIIIAIGAMVDADIVICENIFARLSKHPPQNSVERLRRITEATLEVAKPIIPAMIIIILSFAPIFALQGMEGKLFSPLAFTNVFGMAGALLAAVFLVPILCMFFLGGKLHPDEKIPLVRFLQRTYRPAIAWALKKRKTVLGIAGALGMVGFLAALNIGSEFMPPLDEGSLWYMPITVPDVTEERAQEILLATNKIIAGFPEVAMVVGKAGRSTTPTDPSPLAMFETFITLKPKSEWRRGMTRDKLIGEMHDALQFENVWNGFTQPIIGRIDMLTTGIRTQLGVKIFGEDPIRLEKIAIQIEEILTGIPGAVDTAAIRTMGLQYLNIDLKEELLAQSGIEKGEALAMISAGVGGELVTRTIEGRERYGVEVRLAQAYRQDIEDVRSLPLMGSRGNTVLLGSIADIRMVDGPAEIQSENGVLRAVVQTNVRGRDIGSFVKEAEQTLQEQLELPRGYRYSWSGQYENQQRATKRLLVVVPLALLLMTTLLYFTYRDVWLTGMVLLTIPLGLVGGVLSLFLGGMNFSVAVWVGFISLFGNAVETGTVIVVYLENAFRERFGLPLIEGEYEEKVEQKPVTREGIREAVIEGATRRLRPILMTALASVFGLLPLLFSTGPGADVQRPLALVVAAGLTTSIFLALFVIPVLFTMIRERNVSA